MYNKHAYLIVAYNNWNILNLVLNLLDSPLNDIYLIIDEKSRDYNPDNLQKTKLSKLTILSRRKIFWAGFSQIQAMLDMMREAFKNESLLQCHYSYFHFFSGTCLPLKSQEYIHSFCDSTGKEFIGIVPKGSWYCTKRVKFYWYFINTKYYKPHKILKGFVAMLAFIQRCFGVNRLRGWSGTIYNGWDWASITHDFAEYLLKNEGLIRKMFRKTLCPSELWLHTLSFNSEFRNRLYDTTNLRNGSMRYIDWERGKPYTWGAQEGDFELLMNSPYLFARKFSEDNMEIVNRIYNTLTNNDK